MKQKYDKRTDQQHRSHVSGRRFKKTHNGRNIKDVLVEDAARLERKYVKLPPKESY